MCCFHNWQFYPSDGLLNPFFSIDFQKSIDFYVHTIFQAFLLCLRSGKSEVYRPCYFVDIPRINAGRLIWSASARDGHHGDRSCVTLQEGKIQADYSVAECTMMTQRRNCWTYNIVSSERWLLQNVYLGGINSAVKGVGGQKGWELKQTIGGLSTVSTGNYGTSWGSRDLYHFGSLYFSQK